MAEQTKMNKETNDNDVRIEELRFRAHELNVESASAQRAIKERLERLKEENRLSLERDHQRLSEETKRYNITVDGIKTITIAVIAGVAYIVSKKLDGDIRIMEIYAGTEE